MAFDDLHCNLFFGASLADEKAPLKAAKRLIRRLRRNQAPYQSYPHRRRLICLSKLFCAKLSKVRTFRYLCYFTFFATASYLSRRLDPQSACRAPAERLFHLLFHRNLFQSVWPGCVNKLQREKLFFEKRCVQERSPKVVVWPFPKNAAPNCSRLLETADGQNWPSKSRVCR